MEKKNQYDWLDLIRGVSALAVFLGHLRIICFRDYTSGELDIAGKATFFLTGFGHIAVVIFFVLSGFLIIKSIHESVLKNRWDAIVYAQNRFFRLWVVLIPSLVLGLILDKIGMLYWGNSLFYSNQWKYFLNQDLESKLSAVIFIGNAFFVQKILVPTLGSNGALWSLANEFWYYIIFPFLYFAVANKFRLVHRVLFLVCAIALMTFVGKKITLLFPIWLMGGLSYILSKKVNVKYLRREDLLCLFTALFLISITLCRLKIREDIFNLYTISFIFCLAIPFLINTEMKSKIVKYISSYFSEISYTLYLSHLPFIYLITSMLDFQSHEWNYKDLMIYIGIAVITILYSTLLWYLFENNTKQIKSWVLGKKSKYTPISSGS